MSGAIRFFMGVVAVVAIIALGLLIYGQSLEPDVHRIETEVEINEVS